MQDVVQGAIDRYSESIGREDIVLYDDYTQTGFRVRADHKQIADTLPSTCRWIPDFRLMRKSGAMYAAGVAGLVLLLAVIIGLKGSSEMGMAIGFAAVMASGPLAIAGWHFAPKYRAHDYKAFSVLRRITQPADEEPPIGALSMTEAVEIDGDKMRVYIVPYTHTFLNLANPAQEEQGEEYDQPPVARASILYQDSFQKSLALVMAAKQDTWSRMKQFAPLGIIAAELVFMFLMMNVMMGK
jgi:hypothetical protein